MAIVNTFKSPAGIRVFIVDDEKMLTGYGPASALRVYEIEQIGVSFDTSGMCQDEKIIVVHNCLLDMHSINFEAIVLHEEGHHVLGHLEAYDAAQVDGNASYDAAMKEMEADNYSLARVGRNTLVSALRESMDILFAKMKAMIDSEEYKIFEFSAKQANAYRFDYLLGH